MYHNGTYHPNISTWTVFIEYQCFHLMGRICCQLYSFT